MPPPTSNQDEGRASFSTLRAHINNVQLQAQACSKFFVWIEEDHGDNPLDSNPFEGLIEPSNNPNPSFSTLRAHINKVHLQKQAVSKFFASIEEEHGVKLLDSNPLEGLLDLLNNPDPSFDTLRAHINDVHLSTQATRKFFASIEADIERDALSSVNDLKASQANIDRPAAEEPSLYAVFCAMARDEDADYGYNNFGDSYDKLGDGFEDFGKMTDEEVFALIDSCPEFNDLAKDLFKDDPNYDLAMGDGDAHKTQPLIEEQTPEEIAAILAALDRIPDFVPPEETRPAKRAKSAPAEEGVVDMESLFKAKPVEGAESAKEAEPARTYKHVVNKYQVEQIEKEGTKETLLPFSPAVQKPKRKSQPLKSTHKPLPPSPAGPPPATSMDVPSSASWSFGQNTGFPRSSGSFSVQPVGTPPSASYHTPGSRPSTPNTHRSARDDSQHSPTPGRTPQGTLQRGSGHSLASPGACNDTPIPFNPNSSSRSSSRADSRGPSSSRASSGGRSSAQPGSRSSSRAPSTHASPTRFQPSLLPPPAKEYCTVASGSEKQRDADVIKLNKRIAEDANFGELSVVMPHTEKDAFKVSGPKLQNLRGKLGKVFNLKDVRAAMK